MSSINRALIIQTAFTGDVILATALIEKLRASHPGCQIDFLLRKGNEGLLQGHPHLNQLLVWDKKGGKYANLWKIIKQVRAARYDLIVNAHRFASSGLICLMSGASNRAGFEQNPYSLSFTHKVRHRVANDIHEIDRNQALLAPWTDTRPAMPKLYPSPADFEKVKPLQAQPYVVVAPASVWFTKQYTAEGWAQLINQLPTGLKVYLLGGPGDAALCESIAGRCAPDCVQPLAGQLGYLASAALIAGARMTWVNDSAPLHMATAMGAPVTAVFCSTVPGFGFGPLTAGSLVVETKEYLPCKPCGLHGYARCPKGHFKCALTIETSQLLAGLPQA